MTTAATGNWHEVLEKTEWVAIVTWDGQQAHTVANWGDYVRKLSDAGSDTLVMPAGRYHQTESNLRRDKRVQVILASRQVNGSRGTPGQGYLLEGEGDVELEGEFAKRAKAAYPWARGALILRIRSAQAQL
ncbi:MAG: hypothetical protein IT444_06805 [Phycisphaeraceae bacterium]|nr:hypothetical protein [Phycisphaeraceae bacterium]